ncbi:Auxin response factor 15 [Zea mays]|uniref:Auxin response factor 15 n=1 Tax=Zea mays TaxID=4577 RepID=A0A3L6FR32_MAIZE|nr:Auxin response factor 15 [Zea mays]
MKTSDPAILKGYRHLMEDVLSLLPHVKKDNQDKVESKQSKGNTLNKLLQLPFFEMAEFKGEDDLSAGSMSTAAKSRHNSWASAGQPRRHLLTTGWSAFVNKKKLVSRDAVLFLRGDNGELRLGVRRAAQLKNGSAFPALYNQCSNLGSLPNVAHAVATKSVFHIYYNPRSGGNAYVIGDSAKPEQKWHAYYATTEHP